jgi:hypothetical protein
MAQLRPDLSVDPTVSLDLSPCARVTPGLTGHGQIRTSYHRLRECFGQPDRQNKLHRNAGVWALDTPAGAVHLMRFEQTPHSAGDRDIEAQWAIRAANAAVLPWIYKIVTGTTATFPTGALPYLTEVTVNSLTNAYLDYLYLRMLAETDRRPALDRAAPDFWTQFRRSDQINKMLIALAAVLHHYEWSQTSAVDRAKWSAMDRPAARMSGNHLELESWRQCGRWLYEPVRTGQHPHGGNPDLPGMLRALADTAQEHRPMLRDRVPDLDFALHAEHEQTLRALADADIPVLYAVREPIV